MVTEIERHHLADTTIRELMRERNVPTFTDPAQNAEWLVMAYKLHIDAVEKLGDKIAALEADNARLRDANYDLLASRHGSSMPRMVKVNEAIGQDGE